MARAHRTAFTTLRTEGGLLPADLLGRLTGEDGGLPGVGPTDFHLVHGEALGERITRSWYSLRAAWRTFAAAFENLPADDTGTSLTRERWLLPLFEELGYGRLQTARAEQFDGRNYTVSHSWGHTPIHLVSARISLDRRAPGSKGASSASPHSLVQEFVNRSTGHLWAFVSNGLRLRVLRDNASLTRQAFVEFDLETMFADEVFEDFVVLWLTCHQSRVEATPPEDCWLEKWTALAAEAGTRARDELRSGVEAAIEELGAGFVAHPANIVLRDRLRTGELTTIDLYRQLLRLVYRLLFLFVAEDRSMLHPPTAGDAERRRYQRFYSLGHVRLLASRRRGGPHPDLWRSLTVVFEGLGRTDGIPELGLPGLGSFLWSPAACPDLDGAQITNQGLLNAVRRLAFTEDRLEKVLRPVDYRNLGTEELGAVYESLLEQHPDVNADAGTFTLNTAAGHERKTTGSYYTPTNIIRHVLERCLDPMLAEASMSADPSSAILRLKVLDPACGSGHFLTAAAHRIAKRLAAVRTGDDEPSPDATRHALRDAIGKCIYGIDLNPMAVELCKVSLWMESMEPGKPLGFLDHRIVHGNALLGATPELLAAGIPDDAFKPAPGENKALLSSLRRKNSSAHAGQDDFFSAVREPLEPSLFAEATSLEASSGDSIREVEAKAAKWRRIVESDSHSRATFAAHTWCAAFLGDRSSPETAITEADFRLAIEDPGQMSEAKRRHIEGVAADHRLLHWHLTFLDAYAPDRPPGFDAIIGNPPFLNQLERASALTAKARNLLQVRLPDVLRPYTDLSAIFLALSASHVRPGGRFSMVQPQSLLTARDARNTRRFLASISELQSLWVADSRFFDASVFVCAPSFRIGRTGTLVLERFRGADFAPLAPRDVTSEHVLAVPTWAKLMADEDFEHASFTAGTLREVASATADFRDQYYGLIPFIVERDAENRQWPRLITTGLVDPALCLWGISSTKFGKLPWEAPCVDLARLREDSTLDGWATARLVPKILVASQTKVVEAFADDAGNCLPSVPLLTVVPNEASQLWMVLSVLLSPTVSRWALDTYRGAGLTADSIKLSAQQLLDVPLPRVESHWIEGAEIIRTIQDGGVSPERGALLLRFGQTMTAAYEDTDAVVEWWINRLPRKRAA